MDLLKWISTRLTLIRYKVREYLRISDPGAKC